MYIDSSRFDRVQIYIDKPQSSLVLDEQGRCPISDSAPAEPRY